MQTPTPIDLHFNYIPPSARNWVIDMQFQYGHIVQIQRHLKGVGNIAAEFIVREEEKKKGKKE